MSSTPTKSSKTGSKKMEYGWNDFCRFCGIDSDAIAESVCDCRRNQETYWSTVVLMTRRIRFQPMQRSTKVFVKGVAAKSETLQNYPVLSTGKNCEGILNSHPDQHRQSGTIGSRITQSLPPPATDLSKIIFKGQINENRRIPVQFIVLVTTFPVFRRQNARNSSSSYKRCHDQFLLEIFSNVNLLTLARSKSLKAPLKTSPSAILTRVRNF